MNIYKSCPSFENDNFLIRLVESTDCADLLKVYGDKYALPFFNSDNCDGDNFYYDTKEKMTEAMAFWNSAYKNGWFTRLAISDKTVAKVIGTVELCLRLSEDEFSDAGILRVDVRSDYENCDALSSIISLIAPHVSEMLGCRCIITKAPVYAVERIKAISKLGFVKSEHLLVGKTGYKYDNYWVLK